MAMQWVRLESAWYQNPKFLQLVEDKKWRAITVYMAGLAYCGGQGQAGFIPYYALSVIHGGRADARELQMVGLWNVTEGGWQINDWDEYQPSSDEHAARSKKARDAAMVRWHGKDAVKPIRKIGGEK